MLKQEDRILKNLYNDLGSSLNASFKRDDWSNTKELISKPKYFPVRYINCHMPTAPALDLTVL